MSTTLANVTVKQISEELAKRGFSPEQKVTVTVDQSLSEIARRATEDAERRGLTDALFQELIQSS